MLALGRALMGAPKGSLRDEPSARLAARAAAEVAECLASLEGVRIIAWTTEQNMGMALSLTDRLRALDHGRIVFAGPPGVLSGHPDLRATSLDLASLQTVRWFGCSGVPGGHRTSRRTAERPSALRG